MSRRGVPPLFNAASVKHDMLFTPALSAGVVYISISTFQCTSNETGQWQYIGIYHYSVDCKALSTDFLNTS